MSRINEGEIVFIRGDLARTSTGNTAYYRLTKELREFINKVESEVGEIEGIILDRGEGGDFGFNIGFVCGKDKNKKSNV